MTEFRYRKYPWPTEKKSWMAPTTGRFLDIKAKGGSLKGVRKEK